MSYADSSNETLLSLNVSDALEVGAIENNFAVGATKPHPGFTPSKNAKNEVSEKNEHVNVILSTHPLVLESRIENAFRMLQTTEVNLLGRGILLEESHLEIFAWLGIL